MEAVEAQMESLSPQTHCQGALWGPLIQSFFSVKIFPYRQQHFPLTGAILNLSIIYILIPLLHPCLSVINASLTDTFLDLSCAISSTSFLHTCLISYSIHNTCLAAWALRHCFSCKIYCPPWLLSTVRSSFLHSPPSSPEEEWVLPPLGLYWTVYWGGKSACCLLCWHGGYERSFCFVINLSFQPVSTSR